jgi:diacylglycerol kinase family enzyme
VGKVNERLFFLVVGVGFDALVGHKFDEFPTRGPLPYFYIGTKEYFNYRPARITMKFDDKKLEVQPFLVAIANGKQYGNNALIAPDAKFNDGLFDICIVHQIKLGHLPGAVSKLFTGKITEFSEADFYKTAAIDIEREKPDIINLDGEPVQEDARLVIRILKNCLKVIAPPESQGLIR